MFSYNRPNRKTTFWIDSGDRNDSADYMRTSLKQTRRRRKQERHLKISAISSVLIIQSHYD